MILKNKNILITGAGKGIGLATTMKVVEEGGYVYALVKSKEDSIKFKKSKNIKIFYGNIQNSKIILKIISQSIKDKRKICGLVNNAGVRQRLKFNKITKKNIKEIFDINFFSKFYSMQTISKYFIKNRIEGSVVNIGSIVGNLGFKELAGYAATKTALIGLTKSFANEMATHKIRANLVNPGFTKTSFYRKFKKKKKLYNWTLSRIPSNRWGEPEEIANLICFLLSTKSNYITGETINIDGGWSNA